MVDKKNFAVWMAGLFLSKGQTCTQEMTEVWYNMLKNSDEKQLEKAFKEYMYSEVQWVNAGMIFNKAKPDYSEEAIQEWGKYWNAITGYGQSEKLHRDIVAEVGYSSIDIRSNQRAFDISYKHFIKRMSEIIMERKNGSQSVSMDEKKRITSE